LEGAKVLICLYEAPRGPENQGPRKIGCRVIEHPRGIRNHDLAPSACLDVDIVVSYGDVGDDLEIRALGKNILIDPIRQQCDHSRLALEPLGQQSRGEEDFGIVPLENMLAMMNSVR
jgi:hypothetical protein